MPTLSLDRLRHAFRSARATDGATSVVMQGELSAWRMTTLKWSFGLRRRKEMYLKIASYVKAGTPIMSALGKIRDRYTKNKDNRAVMLGDWMRRMADGEDFAEATRAWIPQAEYILIASAQQSGRVQDGLARAVITSEAIAAARSAVAKIIGPATLFLVLLGLMVGFRLKAAPQFEQLLPLADWSSSGKDLYAIGNFLVNHYVLVTTLIVGTLVTVIRTMPTWHNDWRFRADRFPPWAIYRAYQGSAFMIALSEMLRSGRSVYETVKALSATATPWLREHLETMLDTIAQGEPNMGVALNSGRILPSGLLDDETAGDLEDFASLPGSEFNDVINRMGSEILERSIQKINDITNRMRIIMTILVAMTIAWMYGTTYLLMNNIATHQVVVSSTVGSPR